MSNIAEEEEEKAVEEEEEEEEEAVEEAETFVETKHQCRLSLLYTMDVAHEYSTLIIKQLTCHNLLFIVGYCHENGTRNSTAANEISIKVKKNKINK